MWFHFKKVTVEGRPQGCKKGSRETDQEAMQWTRLTGMGTWSREVTGRKQL